MEERQGVGFCIQPEGEAVMFENWSLAQALAASFRSDSDQHLSVVPLPQIIKFYSSSPLAYYNNNPSHPHMSCARSARAGSNHVHIRILLKAQSWQAFLADLQTLHAHVLFPRGGILLQHVDPQKLAGMYAHFCRGAKRQVELLSKERKSQPGLLFLATLKPKT